MNEDLGGEDVVIDCCGSLFITKKHQSGYYICPLCGKAVFFSERDLILHIGAHARDRLKALHKAPRR